MISNRTTTSLATIAGSLLTAVLAALPTFAAEPAATPPATPQPLAKPTKLWVDRPVDQLGDVKRLHITGNSAFTADTIRERLATDPDVLSAGHATGYLKDYVAVLRKRITEGYRHAGYHEAEAEVDFNEAAKRIDVVVREGKRYRFGEIKVSGNKALAADELKKWLTEPKPDMKTWPRHDPDVAEGAEPRWVARPKSDTFSSKPSSWSPADLKRAPWKAGDFGTFGDERAKEITDLVASAYHELGRGRPNFKVRTSARETAAGNAADPVADLVVEVAEEGPELLIGEIEFIGLERYSRADMLKLLGLKIGDVYDRKCQTRIDRILWNSARFLDCDLLYKSSNWGRPLTENNKNESTTQANTTPAAAPSTSTAALMAKYGAPAKKDASQSAAPSAFGKLLVKVTELRSAPPLEVDFTPEQKAMLKFRSWLAASTARGDEFALRAGRKDDWSLEIIIAPQHGFLVEWSYRSSQAGGARRTFGLESTADAVALYVFDQGKKLEFKPTGLTVVLDFAMAHSNVESQQPALRAGTGARTSKEGQTEPMLLLKSRFTPAAAVALGTPTADRTDDAECKLVDGVLIHDLYFRTRIDAATGKLLGTEVRKRADDEEPELFGADRVSIEVKPGLLAARQKGWRERTAKLRNEYDTAKPVASFVNFLLDEPAWSDLDAFEDDPTKPVWKPFIGLLRKARDADLVVPLVEAWEAYDKTQTGDGRFLSYSNDLYARLADVAFPRDSWPWLQTREFGLVSLQRSRHTQQALERGAAEAGWGPLAFGCAAAGSKKFEYYYLAEPWAEQGMKRIEAADFERDCKPLVDPKFLSGRLLQATARFVRSLDEAETDYLIQCTDSYADWATACVKHLRAEPKQPLEQALPTALRKAWNKEVQVRLAGLMSMWLK